MKPPSKYLMKDLIMLTIMAVLNVVALPFVSLTPVMSRRSFKGGWSDWFDTVADAIGACLTTNSVSPSQSGADPMKPLKEVEQHMREAELMRDAIKVKKTKDKEDAKHAEAMEEANKKEDREIAQLEEKSERAAAAVQAAEEEVDELSARKSLSESALEVKKQEKEKLEAIEQEIKQELSDREHNRDLSLHDQTYSEELGKGHVFMLQTAVVQASLDLGQVGGGAGARWCRANRSKWSLVISE
jgi:hypothetical protein